VAKLGTFQKSLGVSELFMSTAGGKSAFFRENRHLSIVGIVPNSVTDPGCFIPDLGSGSQNVFIPDLGFWILRGALENKPNCAYVGYWSNLEIES
jgi:hypothetical protein